MVYLNSMCAEELSIETCQADQRVDALRVLHAGLSLDQQSALPSTLDAVSGEGDAAFAGLLVAKQGSEIKGAAWVQLCAGRTAVLWPPAIGGRHSRELIVTAAEFLDEHQILLAQVLINPDAPQDEQLLGHGGFCRLVDLQYMGIDRSRFPTPDDVQYLQFVPNASDHSKRLEDLLLATHEQTLDCPQLNGLRDADEVLASYATQGRFAAERWFFVEHQGKDVGVLILTEHAPQGTWELVYMGIVPSARGNGFGAQIVRFAQAFAAQSQAERLVLAVDLENAPALAMYRAAGFTTWDRRRVYARIRPQS